MDFLSFLRAPDGRSTLSVSLTGKCRVCGEVFRKARGEQVVCSLKCAKRIPVIARNTVKAQVKEEKQETARRKEALSETLPKLRAKAQIAFNQMVRARDAGDACICCGQYPKGNEALTGGQWDAGHFRSRGACPELAFDEDNCHLQLKSCNTHGWDVTSYRNRLIAKIGQERVDALEGPHPPKHYTKEDFKAMAIDYRKRAKALKEKQE